jgi:outer membrane biogenesis lipoprotein LolB
MRPTAPICLTCLAVFALAGCSSDREERARYEERQQLRQQGQAEANHAADQGRADLDRATPAK